jgi:alkanesulfonate monooxygenase SsuD/methylene tetrahydromethanopterin reductase-like flavin-dependent oxidoreductase (luciferase family)
MRVDGNIGGGIDGTGGGDLAGIAEQVAAAERVGCDGVWTTEVSRDPFLPLLLAVGQSRTLTLGTAVAVAFARNPMTLAMVANDLQSFSSGRFVLGLGSQIKAHIQRRFSMPWSEPAARMREFVLALRAIWASWQDGSRLDFRGEFYQHTLMTPIQCHGGNGVSTSCGLIPLWGLARLLRIAPVNREMILNYVAQHSLGLPRSY